MKNPRTLPIFIVLILGLFLTSCSGGPITSNWPGLTADENMAYLAEGSFVYAIRTTDASLAWKYPEKAEAKRSFYAPPGITPDGQLIVDGFDSIVYSLNAENGQLNWSFEEPTDKLIAKPVITDSSIYVPSSDAQLYALSLTGAKQWVYKTGHALWGEVQVDNDKLYFGSMDHNLYAVDKTSGKELWKIDLGASVVGSPALLDGKLYVGTVGNEMLAVDATSGQIAWRVSVDGAIWASPVIHENTLFFGDMTGSFYAMDTADGRIIWRIQPDGAIVSPALIIEKGVVFGTEAGTVQAVSFDGTPLWNKSTNGKLYSAPVLAGDRILVAPMGASDQLVVAFDQNGTQLWVFATPK
jgi:outer membrane protein assembly factor BamB